VGDHEPHVFRNDSYDTLGRVSGGTLKSTSSGAQGTQLQSSSDTMLGRSASYAYDGFNSYTYDAEGNITAVTGNAATYVYNALNQSVRTVVGTATTEYVFNANGQRVSEWNGAHAQLKGKYYWDGKPVAYYTTASSGSVGAHFEHTDWLGTERMRTTYNSAANPTYAVEASYTSLPWGDAQTPAANGSDAAHYAQLDHDAETNTDHADYRQYSNAQGRWFSPDPYDGSYDQSNPQSMNRYTYAANSPLSNVDPSGLYGNCPPDEDGWQCVEVTAPDNPCYTDASCQSSNNPPDTIPINNGGARNNGLTQEQKCAGEALKKNSVALALDAASLGADAFGPEAQYAKLGIGLGLSTASMINSAAHKDKTGAGLGMASYLKAPTELAATSAGWGWAKWIPGAGAAMDVYSAYHDVSATISDYNSCMAHP
jgi:RHS repeat-associated protein